MTQLDNYDNIAISALLSLFSIGKVSEVSIFWNTWLGNTLKMPVWATHLGIMLAKNPSGVITSCGPWHGLGVTGECTVTRCSNQRDVSAMNVHGMLWIKLAPTVGAFEAQWYWQPFQTVWFPSSCTSTHAVTRLNILQNSASGPIDANPNLAMKLDIYTPFF